MATKLLTLPEVAELLRKTEAQMRWLRHTGTGPRSALIGGRVMYREEDVETFIEEAFAGPTSRSGEDGSQ